MNTNFAPRAHPFRQRVCAIISSEFPGQDFLVRHCGTRENATACAGQNCSNMNNSQEHSVWCQAHKPHWVLRLGEDLL